MYIYIYIYIYIVNMYLSHTHTLTKEYSSEIYLYGKICDFLMFAMVTCNKVGLFDVYIAVTNHDRRKFTCCKR